MRQMDGEVRKKCVCQSGSVTSVMTEVLYLRERCPALLTKLERMVAGRALFVADRYDVMNRVCSLDRQR